MNLFVFNSEWWHSHAGEQGDGWEPIIVPANAIKCRLIFLPLYFDYDDFARLADIAAESGEKVEPSSRGGWKLGSHTPFIFQHGRPAWQIHHSENGWSVWADLRAASLPKSEYELFQRYADEQFGLFLDAIARGEDLTAALKIADTNVINLSPEQGLTGGESDWITLSKSHRCRPSAASALIVAEALMKSTFAR